MSATQAGSGGVGAPAPSGSDNAVYVNQAVRDRTGFASMPVNGRFSCVRSMRKSLLHKAPADFSTASGENSGADGANSQQNQGVSVMPTGAPVAPWRQAHRPMQACHTGAPERVGYSPETPSSYVALAFKATCGQ